MIIPCLGKEKREKRKRVIVLERVRRRDEISREREIRDA
jgi:hypothetical protein